MSDTTQFALSILLIVLAAGLTIFARSRNETFSRSQLLFALFPAAILVFFTFGAVNLVMLLLR